MVLLVSSSPLERSDFTFDSAELNCTFPRYPEVLEPSLHASQYIELPPSVQASVLVGPDLILNTFKAMREFLWRASKSQNHGSVLALVAQECHQVRSQPRTKVEVRGHFIVPVSRRFSMTLSSYIATKESQD